MSNYGVKELTWENGQLTVNGLSEPAVSNDPSWIQSLTGCETLESVVHQAALQTNKPPGLDQSCNEKEGSCSKKRGYTAEMDRWFAVQEENHRLSHHSMTGSASGTNDTKNMSNWASFESNRSLKTARTGDQDYVRSGSETQETEGEEQVTRSSGRRGRAAAIHNESERRRRDRINQRMRTLQKLLPTASKADKVSILDDVIEHLKQLQAQVQFMSLRANLPQQMMIPQLPTQQYQQQQQQQQQFQMSLLATMARMGMTGNNTFGGLVPQTPLLVPPMTNTDCSNSSTSGLTDPYSAFLAQTMNIDLYNKMAAAMYRQQQSDQSMPSSSLNHTKGD